MEGEGNAAIGLPDKNDHCYVCGQGNACGLKVPFHPDGEGGSRALYTVQDEHIGWPGLLHGVGAPPAARAYRSSQTRLVG